MLNDPIQVCLLMSAVFDQLGVAHLVGGSLASSVHGLPRATQDVDMVADLTPEHVEPLVSALAPSFYLDEESISTAVRLRSSFNLIHLATMMKVDVFVSHRDPYGILEMSRRQLIPMEGGQGRCLPVASPEDIILEKLNWYTKGGYSSGHQWMDVLGVLKVGRPTLDLNYLKRWAEVLELGDLLSRVLMEAGFDADACRLAAKTSP